MGLRLTTRLALAAGLAASLAVTTVAGAVAAPSNSTKPSDAVASAPTVVRERLEPTAAKPLPDDQLATQFAYTGRLFKAAHDATVFAQWRNSYSGTYEYDSITWQDFVDMGRPPITTVKTDVVKYSWAPTLYAQPYFPGPLPTYETVNELVVMDYGQWQRTGFQSPRTVGWIDGTSVFKYATSNELFAYAPDRKIHKLTLTQWRSMGSRSPVYLGGGFVKHPWSSTIYFLDGDNDTFAATVSYTEWRDVAFPSPKTVPTMPGDDFVQFRGDPTIYLWSNDGNWHPLTWSQYVAAGKPPYETW